MISGFLISMFTRCEAGRCTAKAAKATSNGLARAEDVGNAVSTAQLNASLPAGCPRRGRTRPAA
jgi:hypothetical protein